MKKKTEIKKFLINLFDICCFFFSQIHYIDEDRLEHLDLANDRLNRLKPIHFHLIDPTLSLLFKSSKNIPITNLNKIKTSSYSDTEINYKYLEEISEAQGSNGYINRNGTINFNIILAGIHAVICKEYHLKVCELVMNILEVLFGLNIITSFENEQLLLKQKEHDGISEWLEQINSKENEKFQLAIDIILRYAVKKRYKFH